MTIGFAGLTRLRNGRMAAAASMLSLFLGLAPVAAAQETRDGKIDAATAPPSLPTLQANLAERYPSLRALVVARGNCIAFEYYRKDIGAETQSPMRSVTKSVLSILIGIAIDEGYLRLGQKLSEILPDAFDENTDPLAADITVADVLTKTEGFAEANPGDFKVSDAAPGKERMWRSMLNRKVKYPRGTHFRYDGIGSDLLAVVLSEAIKQDAGGFAKRKLFDPLGIANYTWYADSEGVLHGEIGLHLTARDMAKIGILYLQHGRWGDAQIVSADYVQDSTTRHNDGGPPLNAGYGYQWWISKNGNVFFASGKMSQLISVTPKTDLVLAVAADSIPGGSVGFVRNVVLPITDGLPDSAPCVLQVGQDSRAK